MENYKFNAEMISRDSKLSVEDKLRKLHDLSAEVSTFLEPEESRELVFNQFIGYVIEKLEAKGLAINDIENIVIQLKGSINDGYIDTSFFEGYLDNLKDEPIAKTSSL